MQTSPPKSTVPCTEIRGISVSRLGFDATRAIAARWLERPAPRRIATANLDFLFLASRIPELRDALRTADLVVADGQPLLWLARLLGRPIAERVAGSDLTEPLVREAARRGQSVYFLGGDDGVGFEAAEALRARIPELRVAGIDSSRIDLDDEATCRAAVDRIRASGADLLLVALGCPKQDLFLARWLDRTGCRLGIGVGATLDFLAGRVRRAPMLWQRLSLEWAYRLAQEPRRLARRYFNDATFLLAEVVRITARRADAGRA